MRSWTRTQTAKFCPRHLANQTTGLLAASQVRTGMNRPQALCRPKCATEVQTLMYNKCLATMDAYVAILIVDAYYMHGITLKGVE